jgi:hypothetical protein
MYAVVKRVREFFWGNYCMWAKGMMQMFSAPVNNAHMRPTELSLVWKLCWYHEQRRDTAQDW